MSRAGYVLVGGCSSRMSERKISFALAAVHTVILPIHETGHCENVNTLADWAALSLGNVNVRH